MDADPAIGRPASAYLGYQGAFIVSGHSTIPKKDLLVELGEIDG